MLQRAITALIALFIVLVVSMLLAGVLNLGPGEFWIIPVVILTLATLTVVILRRRQHA